MSKRKQSGDADERGDDKPRRRQLLDEATTFAARHGCNPYLRILRESSLFAKTCDLWRPPITGAELLEYQCQMVSKGGPSINDPIIVDNRGAYSILQAMIHDDDSRDDDDAWCALFTAGADIHAEYPPCLWSSFWFGFAAHRTTPISFFDAVLERLLRFPGFPPIFICCFFLMDAMVRLSPRLACGLTLEHLVKFEHIVLLSKSFQLHSFLSLAELRDRVGALRDSHISSVSLLLAESPLFLPGPHPKQTPLVHLVLCYLDYI